MCVCVFNPRSSDDDAIVVLALELLFVLNPHAYNIKTNTLTHTPPNDEDRVRQLEIGARIVHAIDTHTHARPVEHACYISATHP